MARDEICRLTLEEIEKIKGFNYDEFNDEESNKYPLPQWYNRIRHKTLADLTVSDLSRGLRQDIFLDYIGWEIVYRLDNDILLGYFRDGELLAGIGLLQKHWEQDLALKEEVKKLLSKTFQKKLLLKAVKSNKITSNDYKYILDSLYPLIRELELGKKIMEEPGKKGLRMRLWR
ncbi:contact-dependent growth inhibition system immunity protein [Shimazuella sp. AN120528]|uniref:contact-dependent growth inhibition system immunity protein n=1 Tax=Shimazuella soli TaxID=1892854 RepID=UPI001F0E1DC7|nr:contact-dependent growth inhibition system immunity protein [Shimazuella soli]MCH5585435.1 contact-dependent growth inhibition system immunity protein [Shimazuella soli]